MKKLWAILIWGVLVFGIGTYLDKVREMLMAGGDLMVTYILRFGVGLGLAVLVVLVGRWLKRWLGRNGLGPGDWFMIGAVAWAVQGGYGWWMDPRQTVDIQIHDTMFVIWRLHAIGAVVALFVVVGLIYYFGRGMNRVLGFIQFFVTFAALFVLLWIRYFNPAYQVRGYLAWKEFQQFEMVSQAYWAMALLLVAAQLLFVVNLFLMLFSRGRRRAADGRFR
jgi:heme/copper-type cytochrome/quinol oxidase subunit 1